jgi:ABC-type branched-subunit amino acid transport system ATPase component
LGENIDLGGNSARNGVGKCVCINTMVTVRDRHTGEIKQMTMGELYEQTKNSDSGSE